MTLLRNLLLVLEYDGSEYSGWQIQKGKRTIQGTLEEILGGALGETIKVYASGRTDAGVHALGQVVNFWTTSSFSEENILQIIRSRLPKNIKVKNLFEVLPDFHARKSASWKRYLYVILLGEYQPVFLRRYVLFCNQTSVDVTSIMEGSRLFLGTHDFTSFSSPRGKGSTTRTVFSFKISLRGTRLIFDLQANGFLYHMVRFLVGELLMVGLGKKRIEDLRRMLNTPAYNYHRFLVPPQGLYLAQVGYPRLNPYEGLQFIEKDFLVPFWERKEAMI